MVIKCGVVFYYVLVYYEIYMINKVFKNVVVLKVYVGMDDILLVVIENFFVDGIVIEVFG